MNCWILFALSTITLWVVSLWRVLISSSSIPTEPPFLSNLNSSRSGRRKRNVLLLVAHPDDESMFFAPTILYLFSKGHNIHILCISKGDAEGKGNVRIEEIYRASAVLKVPRQQIKIIDHPELQDGFDKPWKPHLVAAFAEEEIEKHGIDTVITFDSYGVSGHPNHQDVHRGLCALVLGNTQKNIEAWELMEGNV
ncbi:hypothetical protein HPP92_027560 [Vanilla planifolia]|uniref:N-acetylglucosaminylphosphatidylinositol deacetylase n=1 Tax=Vanilla planifolia TaxID=51239 RepID=A0A835PBD7_VANPL|nr:hypothetical protein HPP92_027560 [Vanilla planifolia]